MKRQPGVEVRHQSMCASVTGSSCNCRPRFRAYVDDPRSGKKLRKSFGSLTAAKRWREDARVDIRRGVAPAPASPMLGQVADEWLDGVRRGTVRNRSGRPFKPGTIRNYAQAIEAYIKPQLGEFRLASLTRGDVQRMVDDLVETHLSPSGVRNALMPLRGMCRRALIRGDLQVNPTQGLELPAVTGSRDRVASASEAAQLLAVLNPVDQGIWGTAFYAGLRIGEMRALRWMDIDQPRRLLHVRHNWDRAEGLIPPKSAAGMRVLPITDALRALLPARPAGTTDDALVFGRRPAVPFSPSGLVDRAHRVWKAAGLQTINPHECRHTFASFMIAAGVNVKALQVFMGHASITVTLDRYGHLFPGSEDEAGNLLDAYLVAQTAPTLGTNLGRMNPGSSHLEPA